MLRRQSALDCEFPNMAALERFVTAQDAAADGIEAAVAELGSGRKRSHWIWYGFPQLAGLGHSPMAERYASAVEGGAAVLIREILFRGRAGPSDGPLIRTILLHDSPGDDRHSDDAVDRDRRYWNVTS